MKTTTPFDVSEFVRGFEQWDVPALLALYDDDVELTQIDPENPPDNPKVTRGRDVLQGMFEFGATHGVTASVEHVVVAADRAAATVTCVLPDGRHVVANCILEIDDGRIVREIDVVASDPVKGA